MAENTIYPGEQKFCEVTVISEETGLPENLNDYSELTMHTVCKGEVLEKYRFPTEDGYEEITIVDAPNGICKILISEEVSKTLIEGAEVFPEIKGIHNDGDNILIARAKEKILVLASTMAYE